MAKQIFKYLSFLEELKQGPKTIQDLSSILKMSIRTAFRYINDAKKQQPHFKKMESPERGTLYYIDSPEKMESKKVEHIDVIKQHQEELASGGNFTAATAIQQLLNTIQNLPQQNLFELNQKYFAMDHGPFAEHRASAHPLSPHQNKKYEKALNAIDQCSVITITYQIENKSKTIHFCPYKFVLRVGRLYLIGAELKNPTQLRVLLWSKVKMLVVQNQSFKRILKTQMNDIYKYVYGQWVPSEEIKLKGPEKVVFKIHQSWLLDYLSSSHFNPAIQLDYSNQKATLEIYITPDFETWILGLSPGLEVISPIHLRNRIKEQIQLSQKLYQK